MVVRVWKCRSFAQSTRAEHVGEEGRDVVDVEAGVVLVGDDPEVLRQRHLPLAEDGVGDGQDLLRPSLAGVGHVPLAGDGQEQGMDAGRVDGVDGVHARRSRWG